MKLPLKKLEYFWRNADRVLAADAKLGPRSSSARFDEVWQDAQRLETLPADATAGAHLGPFGPALDGVVGKSDETLKAMRAQFVANAEDVTAGFRLVNALQGKRVEAHRVFSNASQGTAGETDTVTVGVRTADYYFATNNYFFVVADFLKQAKGEQRFDDIFQKGMAGWLVAVYPDDKPNLPDQRPILRAKFVSKFLWMLANRHEAAHVISLQSLWNLRDAGLLRDVLGDKAPVADLEADADFDRFVAAWKLFCDALLKHLDVKDADATRKLSKLLFILSLQDAPIRDVRDLLETGNKAVILWGPPGTGKTYEAAEIVRLKLGLCSDESLETHRFRDNDAGGSITDGKGRYALVQFHPSYTYEDFIGGIRPQVDDNKVSYELHQGIFKRFCDEARKPANAGAPFIFIIDEINRANLSAVFGELLYALEYRGESITLPAFRGPFSIPPNVYLIGTMNNVDKSLDTFDLALRRRFGFYKLLPNLDILEQMPALDHVQGDHLRDYVQRCKKLNDSLGTNLGLGPDYLIGQAYFKKIADFLPIPKPKTAAPEGPGGDEPVEIGPYELEKLWTYHLLPLLEEYLGTRSSDPELVQTLGKLKKSFVEDGLPSA